MPNRADAAGTVEWSFGLSGDARPYEVEDRIIRG
jgi:hypothetical protein